MAIKKTKAGNFQVDFRDQSGRRLRKTFDSLKQARQYNKESQGDIAKNEFTAPSAVTVETIANEWHQRKKDANGYRPATLQNWKTHIDSYIVPQLGSFKLQELRIKHVEDAAAKWTEMTSANTANKCLTTLSAIFQLAQRRDLLKQNPAQLAERVKISNDEDTVETIQPDHVYSEEELNRLINANVSGTLERTLIMVPALTGLRIGEVLGLQWSAVDLKANQLHVKTSLIDTGKVNGGRKIASPKSSSSRRTLGIPQELTHELRLWKLACPPSEQDLVFCTAEGKPLHRKGATAILDAAITAAGIKRLTLHKLRHTFASLLLSRNVPVTKVSAYLGHRDPTITLKVYSHFIRDKKNDMQELASSIFGGGL